jgi:cytoskeletal protein RodZ
VRRDEHARRVREEGSDDSSVSSKSDGSSATSPVSSTTTLQTTPSPPPRLDRKDKDELGEAVAQSSSSSSRPITIAVSPVLDPTRLLRPIPFIPVPGTPMTSYTLEAFKGVSPFTLAF